MKKKLYATGVAHPAPYSNALLPVFGDIISEYTIERVLDPMAGVGRIHELMNWQYGDPEKYDWYLETVGVEIEPEWAACHPSTIVGSALALPFKDGWFDAIIVSPAYGNRMADHHNAKDGSMRRSYTHDLGRTLHQENSGKLQWGDEYRAFHKVAWREAVRVLRRRGIFVLNCKDHIRGGERQYVCRFHVRTLRALGLKPITSQRVGTPAMRMGANGELRLHEMVYVFRKVTN